MYDGTGTTFRQTGDNARLAAAIKHRHHVAHRELHPTAAEAARRTLPPARPRRPTDLRDPPSAAVAMPESGRLQARPVGPSRGSLQRERRQREEGEEKSNDDHDDNSDVNVVDVAAADSGGAAEPARAGERSRATEDTVAERRLLAAQEDHTDAAVG